MAVDMNSKLKKWQQNLLDLGKRNANINFKFNKTSNMEIIVPKIFDLWEVFVLNEKEQSLLNY